MRMPYSVPYNSVEFSHRTVSHHDTTSYDCVVRMPRKHLTSYITIFPTAETVSAVDRVFFPSAILAPHRCGGS